VEQGPGLRVLSNERLAALAARGDEGAFAVLYERHRDALYRYCHGILRQHDDAQDAVQATMTRALTGLAGREEGASWNAWLFRIARNEAIDQLRRRRSFEPLAEAHPAPEAAPHVRAEHRERLGAVLRDLRELPARQRDALVMRALGGVAPAEIGASLSLSPGAARQAVFEARATLQEYAAGRDMACVAVRRAIAGGDARRLRARPLSAQRPPSPTPRSRPDRRRA
jgi:RNA polymerase sigma-70 factor (ECF subfamily)